VNYYNKIANALKMIEIALDKSPVATNFVLPMNHNLAKTK